MTLSEGSATAAARGRERRFLALPRDRLADLLEALRSDGYDLLGPTLRDGAIVYGELSSEADLPVGYTDSQSPGRYRVEKRSDSAVFGYAVGPQSWKPTFFRPVVSLFKARREAGGFVPAPDPGERATRRVALIGARGCDLAAIGIQDRVFLEGPFVEPDYAARRQDVFVVAVQCGVASGTCFCVSMGTGPAAREGFDLALTELLSPGGHRFVVEVGSPAGAEVASRLGLQPASDADVAQAARVVESTAASMGRSLDTTDIRDLLAENLEHPRWDEVAGRCLGCTNCTQVCPTCFCSQVEDVTDLAGQEAERIRTWDSCFTAQHSAIHGGHARSGIRSRYRQWLTHKLGTWLDQFGTSGCVGCGRCITWCPVGIDITEETAAIRATWRREAAPGQAPQAATEEGMPWNPLPPF